ncbi:hypothetical protein R1T16_17460 [Flavobacterium sp. DG1-102-2]|uniref:hypothetical protein n=1 Tax=Flavobacterium sp. DG1-102-2 TaxID=3081663 RepID=UPI002948F5BF|nr:hypothetical protein [Flavobacterium sp. DG1-102-2]MDV6170228.1 hypothetical protein [Flavobacterium sp. DG1-102-2]
MAGLQKEVWVAGIKENPIPDTSFVFASVDLSEYVDNNKLHLAEAGVEPDVHEDYFAGNEDDLPIADISDVPGEVVLKTYSTDRTRHRKLQEVELQYNRRQSILGRHKTSLAKNLGKRAAYAWTPSVDNEFNKIMPIAADASVIDAIIDMEAFYNSLDMVDDLNICLSAEHMARIKKEDKKLYKQILDEGKMYGFKVFRYSQNPLYTAANAKKPYGAVKEATDKRSSFTWCSTEVFRCFGDTEMYATLGSAASQADEISFAQRALVGKVRANNPKYLGVIL